MTTNTTNKFQTQGGKPTGFIGYFVGKVMNTFHSHIYKSGLSKISINKNSICLDIGCGGGKAVKLLALNKNVGKVYGLDHSEQMVKLSRKINKTSIKNGLVEILQGSVSSLPFPDSHFDIITAFETIQFWPNLESSLKELRKKLKSSGTFLIVNRLPQEGSKWFDFAQIKNANEYKDKLRLAGFSEISIDIESKKGWILIAAQ